MPCRLHNNRKQPGLGQARAGASVEAPAGGCASLRLHGDHWVANLMVVPGVSTLQALTSSRDRTSDPSGIKHEGDGLLFRFEI